MPPRKTKAAAARAPSPPPQVEEDLGNVLILDEERVLNTYDTNTDYVKKGSAKFKISNYTKQIKLEKISESEDGLTLEFDLIHVEAPIANALRRVLIAEVPTMAIEKIYLYQNTSIIQDEVLCHRLGLLPIYADPRLFEWPQETIVGINEEGVDCDEIPTPDPNIHLVFSVDVTCSRNPKTPSSATEPNDLYNNASMYSKSFVWKPIGDQEERLKGDKAPRMVHDDILVAKLRPNQQIEAICHCVKGIGKDHAKFSPVATASYRLLPVITLKDQITGEAAHRLKSSFSNGVIDIVDIKGVEHAVVTDARRDTCSRNVFRHADLAGKVQQGRIKDHFIFIVESTGALPSRTLVVEACRVMEDKCAQVRNAITAALKGLQLG